MRSKNSYNFRPNWATILIRSLNYLKTSGLIVWLKKLSNRCQLFRKKVQICQIIKLKIIILIKVYSIYIALTLLFFYNSSCARWCRFFSRWASIAPGQVNLTRARSRPRIRHSAPAYGTRGCQQPSCCTNVGPNRTDFRSDIVRDVSAQTLCAFFEILTEFTCHRGGGRGGCCEQCGGSGWLVNQARLACLTIDQGREHRKPKAEKITHSYS